MIVCACALEIKTNSRRHKVMSKSIYIEFCGTALDVR